MSLLLEIFVPGRPRTKGSLKVITPRGRKPILIEDHKHSAPWRKAMAAEIRKAGVETQTDAVAITAMFLFERIGATAANLRWPTVNSGVNANGDIDKLIRNLLDAMQDSGLVKDDCQVVSESSTKRWALSSESPGLHLKVFSV